MRRELFCLVAFATLLCVPSTGLAGPTQLGSARDFGALGASTVTNTGSTTIYGSLGVDPGSALTGFPPGTVTGGSIYGPGPVPNQAQTDAVTAYNALKALPFPVANNLSGQDLGGRTLTPGVYRFNTTAALTGAAPLILDFSTEPGGDFVFQVGTALTTADGSTTSHSSVNVINGSSLSGVYWLMGVTGGSGTGSATLGTNTLFAGNILALDSITLNTSADILSGRAIALNAAVTMDGNRISNDSTLEDFNSNRSDFGSHGFSGGDSAGPVTVPAPGAFLLVCSGLGSLLAFGRKFFSVS